MRWPVEPPPGLNSDDTHFSQQMVYTDAENVRWVGGRAQTIGGWTKEFSNQLGGVCRNLLAWRDLDASVNTALGTHTKLYVRYSGALHDITPAGLAEGAVDSALGPGYGTGKYGHGDFGEGDSSGYFARTWSLQNWGENLIANPRGGTIYVWENNPGTPATAIANAPAQVNAALVTPERQILALGCNEEISGQFNPLCIRFCAIEDMEDWTTSITGATLAGEHVLEPAGGGRIVNGKMIGPYVAVWTDQGLFMGEFVADGLAIYRFDLIATNCGLAGPNAVTVINRRAWWMTPDHLFYTWSPGEAPSLVPCPIRDDMKDRVAEGQNDKIVATGIGQYGEVWWFYPDERDGKENSRYLSLNMAGSALLWSRGRIARSAAVDAGTSITPLFVSPDGYVYSHENGQTANGGVLPWSLTISLPYIDEGGRFVLIKGLEPDIKDQVGSVSLSVALRKYPQDAKIYTKGPYVLTPGARKKDFLMSGRVADLTFSGNSAPTFARFGKPVLIGDVTGVE
jgi:hypothetical protein